MEVTNDSVHCEIGKKRDAYADVRDEFGAVEVDFEDLKLSSRHDGDETVGHGEQKEDFVLEANFPERNRSVGFAFQRYF